MAKRLKAMGTPGYEKGFALQILPPGWRVDKEIREASKQNVKLAFFRYWCRLVEGLGFEHSREMPLVHNNAGQPIYRMVFFARGHDLPKRIWNDVARGQNRSLELF